MKLKDIPTHSVRIKDILDFPTKLNNVQDYCAVIDATEKEKSLFRQNFNDGQFREIKLDSNVIKKHLQTIENSSSGWLKYDKTNGFYLIDYI